MAPERDTTGKVEDAAMKFCCADLYQRDWVRLLLGDSFHPGGVVLTEHLGALINLAPGLRVLDVASGQGTSAIRLAQRFGCQVLGIDYGDAAVQGALQTASAAGVSHLVSFQQGDAEHLPMGDGIFDAVICECAFCTFPNKQMAASEFTRVLKPGGRVGLSDLARLGAVPEDLQSLLAWIACIADALPIAGYIQCLVEAGLTIDAVEPHDDALSDMVLAIREKLFGAELLVKLQKIELPKSVDFEQARALVKSAAAAIKARQFGYAVITATRPNARWVKPQ
jgi:Methylase involved in ubiquinone/menaquinone biosynthesis